MASKIKPFHVLCGFVVLSVVLLLLVRYLAGEYYAANVSDDPIKQFSDVFSEAYIFLWIYISILICTSFFSMIYFRKKKRIEISKGFLYSFIYSFILLLAYVVFILI
jgi:uncharacterized membrane protein